MLRSLLLSGLLSTAIIAPGIADAQPVVTDSRVKTLVYNANDVYALLTHHGYQANIEFGPDERVRTVSVGDKTSWQIIADGRRLFFRSLVAGAHTNMTVITNVRTYQFDLRATRGGALPVREDLVYMARFYYPDQHIPKIAETRPPVYADQVIAAIPSDPEPVTLPPLNFNYTFTGPDELAPSRVFDDGQATYFQLSRPARITYTAMNNQMVDVNTSMTSDGFIRAPLLAPAFTLHYNDNTKIQVFNETMSKGGM